MTPAEERAQREGMPVVVAIAHELIRVASGYPTTLATLDGRQVLLRLPTVDEFLAANARGREEVEAMGVEAPPPPSRTRVAELVAPLPLPGGAR